MCPPVIAVLGLVTSVAGSVVGAMGAAQSANAQAAAAEAQANIQRRQAAIELQSSQQEARRKGEAANKMIGTQLAQYAGSGVTIDGSPTDIIADTRRETMLDQQAVMFGGNLKAENLRYSAQVSDMNAKGYRQAAGIAQAGGAVNAFGNVVSFAKTPTGTNLLSKF